MKTIFLHNAPHPIHASWAESIGAEFISDRVAFEEMTPYLSRIKKVITTYKTLPKNIEFMLCEGGGQIPIAYLYKMKNPKTKLGLILADPMVYKLAKRALRSVFYYNMLNSFDIFFAVSPMMRSFLPKNLQARCHIVPTYIDQKYFKNTRADLTSHNVMFAARICKVKGAHKLVKLAKELRKKVPDSNVFILGHSSKLPFEGDLKKKLEKNSVQGMTIVGRAPDIRKYYSKCSVYVSLSELDPSPASVFEAMSAGLIPVVSKGTGNKYSVRRLSEHLVISNVRSAAKEILELWENKELLKQLSKNAQIEARKYTKQRSISLFLKAVSALHLSSKIYKFNTN